MQGEDKAHILYLHTYTHTHTYLAERSVLTAAAAADDEDVGKANK